MNNLDVLNTLESNTDNLPIPHLNFPKIIHLIHKNYELLEKSHKQWKDLNPEYTIELYDDERCKSILLENFGQLHLDIFNFIQDGAIKCDFFRICIIYLKGGIYVDADVKPLVPLSEFIEDDIDFSTCISYNYRPQSIIYNYNPQFILAQKGDSYLYKIINKYIQYYVDKIEYTYWSWSICKLMEKIHNFHIDKNTDNVFLVENKKYKFFCEYINTNNNLIFDYTNFDYKTASKYRNDEILVCCCYKDIRIFENFSNK
jgi:hypothetical protein